MFSHLVFIDEKFDCLVFDNPYLHNGKRLRKHIWDPNASFLYALSVLLGFVHALNSSDLTSIAIVFTSHLRNWWSYDLNSSIFLLVVAYNDLFVFYFRLLGMSRVYSRRWQYPRAGAYLVDCYLLPHARIGLEDLGCLYCRVLRD